MLEKKDNQKDISKKDTNSASKILNNIYHKNTEDNIKVGVLLKSIDTGGFALLILIFSLIIFIPTPPPIATICGIIIMFFSFQMILGLKEVWLPKIITEKSIKRKTLATIVAKSSFYLYKLERFTRRRFAFMDNPATERIIGVVIFILSIISLTPMLFANSAPGLSIILISFGLLNKDGLIVILGLFMGFLSIFVVWAIFLFGQTVISSAISIFN